MSKSTPSLNEATKRQIKQSTAGINSPYTEKPSVFRKLKSISLIAYAKTFSKKILSLLKRSHTHFLIL